MSLAANSQASPKRPRVLVVANQKGGVGKTTTAINLGTALAAVGEPTLVLDLDPQGNASTGLGVPRADRKLTTYDVLMGEADIEQAVIPTKIPRLSIVPATVDLSGAELELINIERRNFRLKDAIAHYSVHGASQFSYILIDCPPSLSLLTVNAMAAADAVVVPLQCEFFALEGLSQLLKTIERVRANLNPDLEIQGIILTMFDKLHDVPVVVREMADGEALELAIIENIQRADLNAIEEAAAYHELMDRFGYTQERVSQEVGKSRPHVANTLRLLKLPEAVKAMVRDGRLTAGHARTLIGVADPEARAREIVESALNVRQAEQRSPTKSGKTKSNTSSDPDVRALESNLSNMLGLKVHILHKGERGGELRIAYRTLEQLDDIIHRLNKR